MYATIPAEYSDHQKTPLMSGLKPQKITRNFKTGSYLFWEGDEAERVYQVVSGVLRLTRVMENGHRQVMAFGFPGDIIGFPKGRKHQTDCDVLCTAEVIPHRREILENGSLDIVLHQVLLRAALNEISTMQDHFMMLGCKSAVEKVATFLSAIAHRLGEPLGPYTRIALPMSRADIADFLGLSTETVSRTITQLRKSRLIARENNHNIILLQPAALLALSEGGDAALAA